MTTMSTAYETHGRVAQKQRTRSALVAAARELVGAGTTPTVEAAADAAGISRTTAYRYFPNQAALLAAAHPEVAVASLLPEAAPADAEARLTIVVDSYLGTILKNEPQLRTMLRLSLDPNHNPADLHLRQGRVIGWLTEALEPARERLGDVGMRRLVLGIRSATGIESFVWLVDVAGLSRAQAIAQMKWTAAALYRAAVTPS